ncbi:MAG: DUF134 domain-containing protein [Steroidobacteraceae bacterium]|nr:DUF134 domain-containing protein [Steroidobacteraceae bacterium]
MSRPTCPRNIRHTPPSDYFKPAGVPLRDMEEVVLGSDELEAMRLADAGGMYHVEAAKHMGVSRQTFDRIVKSARSKVAKALCGGMALKIERSAAPERPDET